MDYSEVTFKEYWDKREKMLNHYGRESHKCFPVNCKVCPLFIDGVCLDSLMYCENNLKAIEIVMNWKPSVDWSKVPVDTKIVEAEK